MDDEKRGLLLELREHTVDCDCNRSRHFIENGLYNKYAAKLNRKKQLSFVLTIFMAVIVVPILDNGYDKIGWLEASRPTLTFISECITILIGGFSVIQEIKSNINNYDQIAIDHWLAAQAYAALYRKCQFFCSLYYNSSIDVWREKLDDIAEEIGHIALLSPSLHDESYKKWKEDGGNDKPYPVDHYIKKYNSHITEIINDMKFILNGHEYKIYLYGSYIQNMFNYDDIDLAIIIFDLEFDKSIQDSIFKIALNYFEDNQSIDINIIFKDELKSNINKQYYKNILAGKLLYSSPNVKEDLQTYDLSNEGYKSLALSYKESVSSVVQMPSKNINLDTYRTAINDAFYVYYNTFAFVLSTLNIDWDGEDSCISKFKTIIHDPKKTISLFNVEDNKLDTLVEHAFKIYKYKQSVYLQLDKKYLIDIKNYLDKDSSILNKLLEKR